MLSDEKPKNIFEPASQPDKTSEEAKDLSFEEMFDKCSQFHEKIANEVDSQLQRVKLTPSKIRSYLSHPQNFSQKDWRIVSAQQEKNQAMLDSLIHKIGHAEKKERKKKIKKKKIVTRRKWIKMD